MNFVCLFEGTWNDPQKNPSVISKLKDRYLIRDEKQHVFLFPGSGRYGWLHKRLKDGWKGRDWDDIVSVHYGAVREKIDELKSKGEIRNASDVAFYVFGFSRGAYQAKVFINGLCRYGFSLEAKEFVEKIRIGAPVIPNRTKVRIKFVGLFDTVCATENCPLGLENPQIPSGIDFRHALAINEYRSAFEPQLLSLKGQMMRNQQWFIGCHSDIGWAYNPAESKMNELVNWMQSGVTGSCPITISTSALGKIALHWVLESCKGLRLRDDFRRSDPLDLFAYCNMAVLFPYLIHDSYKSLTNIGGETKRRNCVGAVFHDSVRGVSGLLESEIYRADDKIPVQRVENRDGWFDTRGEEKKLSRGVAFSDLLKVKGGDVFLPVAIVGRDRRIMKPRVQKEVSDSISLYRGKTKVAYRILKDLGLISESWGSFANRIGNDYLESCWRYYRLSSKMGSKK